MTRKLAVILFGLLLTASAAGASENPAFRDANAAYIRGDYKAAASAYEKIITAGRPDAGVYYNLGNAYFRAGEKGRAMAAFERAHRLDPRDKDIEWNKGVLKNALIDRIEDADESVFISSLQKILEWVTADEVALVFAGILTALFFFSLFNYIFHKTKPFTAGIGGVFVFLWIVSGAVFYMKWTDLKEQSVVILDREVAARYGPSEKETKAFVLHEGAEARIADRTGDWYYIALKNKTFGWVPKKSCEVV